MVKYNLSTLEKRTAGVNRGGDHAYAVPVLGEAHGGWGVVVGGLRAKSER